MQLYSARNSVIPSLYYFRSGGDVLCYPDITSYGGVSSDSNSSQDSSIGVDNDIVLQNRVAGNALDRFSVGIQREAFRSQGDTLI